MKKNNSFMLIVAILIAIVIIVIITNILLDTTGSINQGKFRVNDVVIKSIINVEEINEQVEENNGFDNMKLNLSQNNTLVMLIPKDDLISKFYIDGIDFKAPNTVGEVSMYEGRKENITSISFMDNEVQIYPIEQEDQYLIEINIDNKNFLTDAKIPTGTNSLTFDGSMLKVLDIPISKLQFDLKFNINIVETTGKINTCKIDIKLPEEDLIENGISIKREDLSKYKFKIKNKLLLFRVEK